MTIRQNTVLVTGGAGMIGSHLVETLISRECEVTVLDDLSSGDRDNVPAAPSVRFIQGTITDEQALDAAFDRRFDVVFHLAANFANKSSVDHPEKDLMTNGLGILKVLERCRRSGVGRFAYASSSCVYGNQDGWIEETTTRFDPGTPYAITKLLGERYTTFFTQFYGLSTVTLRYFNCYGPRERPGKYRNVIPNFFYAALCGQPLTITGDGTETRDFCYVSDIVKGTLLAAEHDEWSGEVFNIATGRAIRILDLAERINRLTNNPAGVVLVGRRDWDHVVTRQPSIEKARARLGYEADMPFDRGLGLTYDWLHARFPELRNHVDL